MTHAIQLVKKSLPVGGDISFYEVVTMSSDGALHRNSDRAFPTEQEARDYLQTIYGIEKAERLPDRRI